MVVEEEAITEEMKPPLRVLHHPAHTTPATHTHMPPPPPPPTSTPCCLLGMRQDQELMLPRPRPPEGHVRAYIPISSCFLDAHTVPLTAPSTL